MTRPLRCTSDLSGLSVGELAGALGVTVRSLRHYEAVGLLAPRRIGNRRLYDAVQQGRARAVSELRRLDISLQDIGRALDETRGEEERRAVLATLLAASLSEINARARRTRTLLGALEAGEAMMTFATCRQPERPAGG